MEPRRGEKAQTREERARVKAKAARVEAEAARVRVNPFVIEGRTSSGIDWQIISERAFTGDAEDPETGMAPRPLDQCRAYMRSAVGLCRIVPASTAKLMRFVSSNDDDRYVVEQRQIRREWEVVSKRQFTGNPDDVETGMAPRLLDECWEYMGHKQGQRRVVPA